MELTKSKSYFRSDSKVVFVNDYVDLIELLEPLEYYSSSLEELIHIPMSFQSDGASIPKAAWSLAGHPFQPRVRPCGILHDFLYRSQIYSKYLCDSLFYEAMLSMKVSPFKAKSFYTAVGLFGSKSYNNTSNNGKLKLLES